MPHYTTIVVLKARRDFAPQIMIVICYDLNGDCQYEAQPALAMLSALSYCTILVMDRQES